MDTSYFFNGLYLIKPELVVSLFLVLVLLSDLVFPKAKKALPVLAGIGILIAIGFVAQQFFIPVTKGFMVGKGRAMIATDSFGNYFKLLILGASFFIVVFSTMSEEIQKSLDRIGEYYTLMFGMMLGMMFMVSATDFLLIYLSVELVSLSSYVLAGYLKQDKKSTEASLKYVIYGAVSSGIMLFGISILFGMTGTTNLYEISLMLRSIEVSRALLMFVTLMIFVGIGYKISSVPFHFWTPDVYEGAPTSITAYLSVASKAAGFAMLIRIIITVYTLGTSSGYWLVMPFFDWKNFLVFISIITMFVGNLSALWQDNVKRMLAYSSIAHAGYLLAALAVMTNDGMSAVMVYFSIYIMMNLGAFLVVILISNKIHSENINDYNGIGYRMPLYSVCMGVFLVSLTGLPPTAGFIGKLYIFMALLSAKMYVLAVVGVLNSVISLYYYIRVLKHMFLVKPEDATVIPNKLSQAFVVVALAIPVLLFGIYFTPLSDLAKYSTTFFGILK